MTLLVWRAGSTPENILWNIIMYVPLAEKRQKKLVDALDKEIHAEANADFIEDLLSGKYILVDNE